MLPPSILCTWTCARFSHSHNFCAQQHKTISSIFRSVFWLQISLRNLQITRFPFNIFEMDTWYLVLKVSWVLFFAKISQFVLILVDSRIMSGDKSFWGALFDEILPTFSVILFSPQQFPIHPFVVLVLIFISECLLKFEIQKNIKTFTIIFEKKK